MVVGAIFSSLLFAGQEANAKKKKTKPAPLAVYLGQITGTNGGAHKTVLGFFSEASVYFENEREVLVGKTLSRSLNKELIHCKDDTSCMKYVAKAEDFISMVIAEVDAESDKTVSITFERVNLLDGTVEYEAKFEAESPAELQKELATRYFEIVGITTPGFVVFKGKATMVEIDGQVVPLGKKRRLKLAPGVHILGSGEKTKKIVVLPREKQKINADLYAADTEIASADLPSLEAPIDHPNPALVFLQENNKVVSYAGMGTAGLGAGLILVGSYFGIQSNPDISSSTSQYDANQSYEDAKDSASTANKLFVTGLVLGVVGGAIWGASQWAIMQEDSTSVSVAVDDKALSLGVTLRF